MPDQDKNDIYLDKLNNKTLFKPHIMKVLLLCGYKTTGKDSIFIKITQNVGYQWRVYSSCDVNLKEFSNASRLAFADLLKHEVSCQYNIPSYIPDSEKEKKQFVHDGVLVSARDLYIKWANIKRDEDIDYWVKKAYDNVDEEQNIIVTDLRQHNELNYTHHSKLFNNITTMRLFRSEVPIPPLNISSEHQLDDLVTDIICIPEQYDDELNAREFELCIQQFPQYNNYTYHYNI